MGDASNDILRVEVLGSQHDRSEFESGVGPLDKYFQTQARQDARKRIAAPFVLILPDGSVVGYYTLSSTAVKLPELPETIVRKLPRYPLIPATLLGRLTGVDAPPVLELPEHILDLLTLAIEDSIIRNGAFAVCF